MLFLCLLALALACGSDSEKKNDRFPGLEIAAPADTSWQWPAALTREIYADKVLGMLIGSAIGDAMGAPTEMWHRSDILRQVGYVSDLGPVTREASPEGPWQTNLPPGGTTDDTRWKYLIGSWLAAASPRQDSLDARAFAQRILDQYLAEKDRLKTIESFSPAPLEAQMLHIVWLQEWAKVSRPYLTGDIDAYSAAVNQFYGGEMSCAGMLYAPMMGAYFPAHPQQAYRESYRLGLFDLGYARDITGLTAAYVSQAMQPGASAQSVAAISATVDPRHYAESRLIGRTAHRIYEAAQGIVWEAKAVTAQEIPASQVKPAGFDGDALAYAQMQKAYELLDARLQDIPFHAAEIHLINLTALVFADGDFRKAMEFVVNYGRDNDTVAAITGAILGAQIGAKQLPAAWKEAALQVNRDLLGMDLEKLADELVAVGYGGK